MVRVCPHLVWTPGKGSHQCLDVGRGQGDVRGAEGPDHVNAHSFQVCPGEHDDRRNGACRTRGDASFVMTTTMLAPASGASLQVGPTFAATPCALAAGTQLGGVGYAATWR